VDYTELSATQIQTLKELVTDDVVCFRVALVRAALSGGGGGGSTLQDAYLAGNTISTLIGQPFTVGGSATKVAQFNGDIGVTGVIDPTAIEFTPQASSPLTTTQRGLWVNASDELVFDRGETESPMNLTQSIQALSNPTYLGTEMVNDSGLDISSLRPVSISASTGNLYPTQIDSESLAMSTVGITVDGILSGATGEIATHGRLMGITTSFNYGDILYVDTNGMLTNIKPAVGVNGFLAGDWVVKIGTVCRNTGSVLVKDLLVNVQIVGQL
jgi:hypothetical protein